MLILPPAYLQAGQYSARSDRQHLITATHYKNPANAARARGGLLPDDNSWSALYSVSNWEFTLGPFRAIVENTFDSNGGDYKVLSTGNEVRSITPSSTTTNRIDIVGVQVFDSEYEGTDASADIVIVEGTPAAGTPAAPVLPPSFEPFYELRVDANSTDPVVTSLRRRTGLLGTVIPIFSDTQFAEDGAYAGEQQLLEATGILPERMRYWGYDDQWHGAQVIELDPIPATGAGADAEFTSTTETTYVLASVTIPDPGYPYYVVAGGAMFVGDLSAGEQAAFSHTAYILADTTTVPAMNAAQQPNTICGTYLGIVQSSRGFVKMERRRSLNSFSGSHTLNMIYRNGVFGTANWGPLNDRVDYYFNVAVVPA